MEDDETVDGQIDRVLEECGCSYCDGRMQWEAGR